MGGKTGNAMLAIIPARGGSKGIPRKNIVDLGGKPLIQYTIEPALNLLRESLVDNVIVSTDSEEIAALSRSLGADVPFIRPAHLAADNSGSIGLIGHALNYFASRNVRFHSVLLLQPTSPLRNMEDLRNALKLWNTLSGSGESLISVYREEHICDLVMYRKAGQFGVPCHEAHNRGIRRQDHPAVYIRNGALYITKVSYLRRAGKIISDRPILYVMPRSRSVNVDTRHDLSLARWLMGMPQNRTGRGGRW